MPDHRTSFLSSRAAALMLLGALAAAGCVRPLAIQDEYFTPGSGTATRNNVATRHLVSHHRALQAALRSCATAPSGAMDTPPGPELGDAAAREALGRLCASLPPQPSVAAYGAMSNAYRRWVNDAVHELPEASRTAASAAGGS